MGCGAETKDLVLEDQKGCIRGCEEFKYLGVKIDQEDKQENYINQLSACIVVYRPTVHR